MFARFLADYSMLLVLAALCAFFSVATYAEQHPTGAAAATAIVREVVATTAPGAGVLVVAGPGEDDRAFVDTTEQALTAQGRTVRAAVQGTPADARAALQKLANAGGT